MTPTRTTTRRRRDPARTALEREWARERYARLRLELGLPPLPRPRAARFHGSRFLAVDSKRTLIFGAADPDRPG